MALRINSEAPNFTAETTQGRITFHDWRARAKCLVVHHPDVSTRIHCECETAYAFHQALAGHPPRILDCNCEAPD